MFRYEDAWKINKELVDTFIEAQKCNEESYIHQGLKNRSQLLVLLLLPQPQPQLQHHPPPHLFLLHASGCCCKSNTAGVGGGSCFWCQGTDYGNGAILLSLLRWRVGLVPCSPTPSYAAAKNHTLCTQAIENSQEWHQSHNQLTLLIWVALQICWQVSIFCHSLIFIFLLASPS